MRRTGLLKSISILMVALMMLLSGSVTFVQAAMIETADSLALNNAESDRMKLQRLIERSDVRRQLANWGIQPAEAQAAVDHLTDAEISDVARNLESLPAGGDALGVIVGAALVVFLVLLITDILGYTNVFPFVEKGL